MDTKNLILEIEQALANNDRRTAGILLKRVLETDFNNQQAWRLLHKMLAADQPFDTFQKSFVAKYYPQKAHLLEPAIPVPPLQSNRAQPGIGVPQRPTAVQPVTAICPKCKAEITGYRKFCSNCGAALPGYDAVQTASPAENSAPTHKPTKKKSKIVPCLVVLAILSLVACLLIFWAADLNSISVQKIFNLLPFGSKSTCDNLVGEWEGKRLKVSIQKSASGYVWEDQFGRFPAVCKDGQLNISLGMPGGDGVAFYDEGTKRLRFIAPGMDYNRGNEDLARKGGSNKIEPTKRVPVQATIKPSITESVPVQENIEPSPYDPTTDWLVPDSPGPGYMDIISCSATPVDSGGVEFVLEVAAEIPQNPGRYTAFVWGMDTDKNSVSGYGKGYYFSTDIGIDYLARVAFSRGKWSGFLDKAGPGGVAQNQIVINHFSINGSTVTILISQPAFKLPPSFFWTAHTLQESTYYDVAPNSGHFAFP